MKYCPFEVGKTFEIKHLKLKAINVNHKVPTVGFIISDKNSSIALSSDTSKMKDFWETVNKEEKINAVLVECAFPNNFRDLAEVSHHLTPKTLEKEIIKLEKDCPIYVINLKPMYREEIILELEELDIKNLNVLDVGKIYNW
jgi:cAMP phosphodiesterase